MMEKTIKQRLTSSAKSLRLPRYSQIPDMGLYLEQVVKYINEFLEPINCAEITASMISNYVKHGIIPSPHKKQYDADRIVYLIFIAIAKNALSLENIVELFAMQREGYSLEVAYDYFCCEFENVVGYVFGVKEEFDQNIGVTQYTEQKELLRNVIISVSHSLYANAYFDELKRRQSNPDTEQ